MEIKKHWEKVFATKTDQEKSWFQAFPEKSVQLLQDLSLPKNAAIIDVGGGDSLLAGILLEQGFTDITVLDISGHALENAKKRLGNLAEKINWIESDVLDFIPPKKYDCWHDRAVFHFVTGKKEMESYKTIMANSVSDEGKMVVATFSEKGPEKCSGLPVHRYSKKQLSDALSRFFIKIKCVEDVHHTPFNTQQLFTFCSFKKRQLN